MGFHSDSETLRYIVRSHIVQNQEENSKLLSILRKVEEKIDILFDIENTKLIQQEAEVLYPVSMLESPVVTKASALRKENLANKKQKADIRNRNKETCVKNDTLKRYDMICTEFRYREIGNGGN